MIRHAQTGDDGEVEEEQDPKKKKFNYLGINTLVNLHQHVEDINIHLKNRLGFLHAKCQVYIYSIFYRNIMIQLCVSDSRYEMRSENNHKL